MNVINFLEVSMTDIVLLARETPWNHGSLAVELELNHHYQEIILLFQNGCTYSSPEEQKKHALWQT